MGLEYRDRGRAYGTMKINEYTPEMTKGLKLDYLPRLILIGPSTTNT